MEKERPDALEMAKKEDEEGKAQKSQEIRLILNTRIVYNFIYGIYKPLNIPSLFLKKLPTNRHQMHIKCILRVKLFTINMSAQSAVLSMMQFGRKPVIFLFKISL